MKTPTKKELQRLAEAAFGEIGQVQIARLPDCWMANAVENPFGDEVTVYTNTRGAAKLALAAALRALAEVKQ